MLRQIYFLNFVSNHIVSKNTKRVNTVLKVDHYIDIGGDPRATLAMTLYHYNS